MSLVDDLYKAEEEAKKREPIRPNIVDPIVSAIREKVEKDFSSREFKGYFVTDPYQDWYGYKYLFGTIKENKGMITEGELISTGYTSPTFYDLIEEVTIRAKEEIGLKEFFMTIEHDIKESIPYGKKRGLFGRNATKLPVVYIYMEAKW